MGNQNMASAKLAKKDEFYTQYHDIEIEINAYLEYNPDVFRGKTVECITGQRGIDRGLGTVTTADNTVTSQSSQRVNIKGLSPYLNGRMNYNNQITEQIRKRL